MTNAWLNINFALRDRSRKLLWELQLISYAPTSAPLSLSPPAGNRSRIACPSCDGKGEVALEIHGAARSRVCPRCRGRGDTAGQAAPRSTQAHHESAPPPPCESLYEEFVGKFAKAVIAGDEAEVESLCEKVTTALAQYRGQYKPERDLPTDEEDAMKKVVEVYVGVDPVEVSRRLASKVSPGWVEKARRVERRNPESGEKLEGWQGMSNDERKDRVKHARTHGWSIRRAADELGVPRSTLHREYGWGGL